MLVGTSFDFYLVIHRVKKGEFSVILLVGECEYELISFTFYFTISITFVFLGQISTGQKKKKPKKQNTFTVQNIHNIKDNDTKK